MTVFCFLPLVLFCLFLLCEQIPWIQAGALSSWQVRHCLRWVWKRSSSRNSQGLPPGLPNHTNQCHEDFLCQEVARLESVCSASLSNCTYVSPCWSSSVSITGWSYESSQQLHTKSLLVFQIVMIILLLVNFHLFGNWTTCSSPYCSNLNAIPFIFFINQGHIPI